MRKSIHDYQIEDVGIYGQMASLLTQCRRQGYSCLSALKEIQGRLRGAFKLAQEASRLWQLFWFRCVAGMALSYIGRMLLDQWGAVTWSPHLQKIDHAAIGMAILLASCLQSVFLVLLPRSWIWHGQLTDLAKGWFVSYLKAAPVCGAPMEEKLKHLERRQFIKGVSLRQQMQLTLGEWADKQTSQEKQQLQTLGDWLPLMELAGIGFPCCLLLLCPALALVA